ncbi:MAG: glycosyltransferase family 2 protein [Vicinamibacterales bacterium]
MPTVSVIMPAYNVAPYLPDAIESVLSQTFRDLELIIVDDGSPDSTFDIASDFARRDSRVRVLRQKNRGISSARNHAMRVALGSLFAILDSDDMWSPSYLERQLAILANNPACDIVTGNARLLGSARDGQPARPTPDDRGEPTLARMLEDETAVFIMSVFRRRVYEVIGGFDESMRTNEDYDFWIRAAIAGFRFCRNDEPLGRYRRRDDSLSAGELPMLHGIIRVLRKTRSAIKNRPAELAIVESQLLRFETELLAAQARSAIEEHDFRAASERLVALHRRRGGLAIRVAGMMARWTPGALSMAYNLRRAHLASRVTRERRAS